MSGITDNYGCSDCLTLGRHLNSTESYTYSHVEEGDELLKYIWREYLYPKQYEWVLIAGYIIVFLLSLVGNTLVCFTVWKNDNMHTVTNYFIVNLSFPDILVTITCLPASLVTISVSVSVLTLSHIAQDRRYAICHPLKIKSMVRRATEAVVIECSSLLPELLPELTNKTIRDEHWGDEIYPKVYHTCFFIVTYFAPLCLMVLAYIQICHKLWCQIPGTSSVLQRKYLRCIPGESVKVRKSTVSAQIKQTRTRRKTARMLIVVLLFFTICYLPISVLNVMKRVFGGFKSMSDREMVYAWFTFTHWLIYANSASNPIIYNFLSGERSSKQPSPVSTQAEVKKEWVMAKMNTDSHKSLSTQVSHLDNVSWLSDQAV
uniref:G-protein coupled receptors family 1 profile domain-containing protein n=1 Tax=Electrophorus electricus TaxID=8005 RepID=A0A4W4F0E4_ELEEL